MNKLVKRMVVTGVCAGVMVAVLGGCGNSKPTLVEPSPKATTEKTATKEPVAEKTKKFKVGDIVKLTNLQVKVNKVYTVKAEELAKPADGNEYFAIDCTIENISSAEQSVSSIMMFKVVDKEGRAQEMSVMGTVAAKAGQLDGAIAAGRKMTGVYVVEVPKGTTGLELEFDASLISSGQMIVQLN